MDDLTRLSEDQLFKRFVCSRDAAVWREIAVRNFDRIEALVAGFRFPSGQFIPEFEQGSVVTEAWLRVNDIELEGSSIGELRNAVRKTVWHACMDWGRRRLAYERHIGGSLDEPGFEDEGGGSHSRYDPDIAAASREREALAEEAETDAELRGSYIAMVRSAISRVKNDNYREVLYMTYVERAGTEAIAARLGLSLDNVYQRRRRGNLELEKLLSDQRT
jgi:DNA-directed RNA polymerase specialized sigma24 family protein